MLHRGSRATRELKHALIRPIDFCRNKNVAVGALVDLTQYFTIGSDKHISRDVRYEVSGVRTRERIGLSTFREVLLYQLVVLDNLLNELTRRLILVSILALNEHVAHVMVAFVLLCDRVAL